MKNNILSSILLIFLFNINISIASEIYDENISVEIKENLNPYIKDIPNEQFTEFATIQILDKIMAISKQIDIKISEIYQFKTLSILPYKCWKSNPEDPPENKLLLTIADNQIIDGKKRGTVFNGWMFSSSPSISSMEHIIYDITLIKCFNKENAD